MASSHNLEAVYKKLFLFKKNNPDLEFCYFDRIDGDFIHIKNKENKVIRINRMRNNEKINLINREHSFQEDDFSTLFRKDMHSSSYWVLCDSVEQVENNKIINTYKLRPVPMIEDFFILMYKTRIHFFIFWSNLPYMQDEFYDYMQKRQN